MAQVHFSGTSADYRFDIPTGYGGAEAYSGWYRCRTVHVPDGASSLVYAWCSSLLTRGRKLDMLAACLPRPTAGKDSHQLSSLNTSMSWAD
ncbi:hypothetical protein ABW21_db0204317 [Orbilia brochopaga]|nr:hypothetical protein ABW21_db0204317 [Drechslerella brochopaga]